MKNNDNDPTTWDADHIRNFYDHNWDIRLADLARMTGRTLASIKRILRA